MTARQDSLRRTFHDAGFDVVSSKRASALEVASPLRDGATSMPIELDAEFIHAGAPELTRALHKASLSSADVGDECWTTNRRTAALDGRDDADSRSRNVVAGIRKRPWTRIPGIVRARPGR